MRAFDVILYDAVSAPFNPRLAEERGLGGVEWVLMLLAEALANDGLHVLVLNKWSGSWHREGAGWLEYGHVSRAFESDLSCSALVVSRWSPVPPIEARRTVFSMHDIPERWMYVDQRKWLDDGAPAVCVSSWLASKLGEVLAEDYEGNKKSRGWRREAIAPMLLDECYERGPKDQNKMVYASAAIKGATATLDVWENIREHFAETHWGELFMATNGYDDPSPADKKRMDEIAVRPLGQLPAKRIISELRGAAGLFFVNTLPETHCLIASTALALGCRCHVLATQDLAALPETLAGAPLLTTDKHGFIEQYVDAFLHPDDPRWVLPVGQVPDRTAATLLPKWREVLFDG